jgi:TonB family protein
MMVFSPKAYISIVISILIHIIFIMKIFNDETKDQEIYVLNLSSYQQVQFEKQKTVPKEIEKEPKIDKKKKIEKKVEKKLEKVKKKIEKVEKKLPIQPIEKIIKQNEIDDNKILEKKRKENFVPQKQVTKVVKQSSQLKNFKNKILIDKILGEYLKKISIQINRMATQSYPLQSIKRREQGTIKIIITLNENGKILELFFENKKPKRLYKATKKIIESFSFPKPSKEILTANNTLRVKIPVNFILK